MYLVQHHIIFRLEHDISQLYNVGTFYILFLFQDPYHSWKMRKCRLMCMVDMLCTLYLVSLDIKWNVSLLSSDIILLKINSFKRLSKKEFTWECYLISGFNKSFAWKVLRNNSNFDVFLFGFVFLWYLKSEPF